MIFGFNKKTKKSNQEIKKEKKPKKDWSKFIERERRGLESFELNEETFRNAGTWPVTVKIISMILLVGTILFLSNQFYFKSLKSKYENMLIEEVKIKDEVLFKIQQTAGLKLYEKQINEMESSFEAQLSQLPTDIEMDGLLKDITEKGIENGVEFKKFQMLKEFETEFYIELPIEIIINGTYHSLARFISEVSNLNRIVTFHDFELRNSGDSELGLLELKVIAKTYKYRKKVEVSDDE
tara:strand:+ start:19805 stop:20518 length:714 start_codon:yes stop_codon:yes gene_type:complete